MAELERKAPSTLWLRTRIRMALEKTQTSGNTVAPEQIQLGEHQDQVLE